MESRRVGGFERLAPRREKAREVGEVVAVSGNGQPRRAAFGREHFKKGFQPP